MQGGVADAIGHDLAAVTNVVCDAGDLFSNVPGPESVLTAGNIRKDRYDQQACNGE